MYSVKIESHTHGKTKRKELDLLLNPELPVLRDLFFPFSTVLEPFQGRALFFHGGKCAPCLIPCFTLCSWCRTAQSKRKSNGQGWRELDQDAVNFPSTLTLLKDKREIGKGNPPTTPAFGQRPLALPRCLWMSLLFCVRLIFLFSGVTRATAPTS